MIIFGTRGITTTPERGQFYCPSCGPQMAFAHKRVRRFFTLYFIPVIPLDKLGEYVECQQCFGTFNAEVLKFDPEVEDAQFKAEFHYAIGRVMVLMMIADGDIDPEEVRTIQQVYGKLTGTELTEAGVHAEAESARKEGLSVEQYLGNVGATLNNQGKELVVSAAFMVAAADGHFDAEEMKLLESIGKALQLTKAHYQGLIDSLMSDANVARG